MTKPATKLVTCPVGQHRVNNDNLGPDSMDHQESFDHRARLTHHHQIIGSRQTLQQSAPDEVITNNHNHTNRRSHPVRFINPTHSSTITAKACLR